MDPLSLILGRSLVPYYDNILLAVVDGTTYPGEYAIRVSGTGGGGGGDANAANQVTQIGLSNDANALLTSISTLSSDNLPYLAELDTIRIACEGTRIAAENTALNTHDIAIHTGNIEASTASIATDSAGINLNTGTIAGNTQAWTKFDAITADAVAGVLSGAGLVSSARINAGESFSMDNIFVYAIINSGSMIPLPMTVFTVFNITLIETAYILNNVIAGRVFDLELNERTVLLNRAGTKSFTTALQNVIIIYSIGLTA